MDWNDLRHFLAVARLGGLSAAARASGGSPATIGRHIQSLENSLGVALFERLRDGYVLTPAGRDLLIRAEAAEAAIDAVMRGAGADDGRLRGTVRLATAEATAAYLIAPALPALRAAHPDLTLEIVTGVSVVSLSRRESDLALRLVRPDQGDHVRRRVGTLGFGFYAAPALAEQAGGDPWTLPLVGWDPTMAHLRSAEWLRKFGRGPIAATAGTMNVQIALTVAGVGAAILPCLAADAVPGLVRLVGPDQIGFQDLWLVAHADLSRVARVRAVMDFLGDLCRDHAARLRGI